MIIIHILRLSANFYLKKNYWDKPRPITFLIDISSLQYSVNSFRAIKNKYSQDRHLTVRYCYSTLRDHLYSNWNKVQFLRNRSVIPLAWSGNLSIVCTVVELDIRKVSWKPWLHDDDSPLMLPDTSITKAMLFSDFRFRNLAKVSSPTAERTSFRKLLVASMAMSAAILWRL